jgi:FixJ family two-component response regulator
MKGSPVGANIAIAIVDDDELVRSSMAGLLRSFGIETAVFESADALLLAGANSFDCIVSDLQMPGTSGLELKRILNDQADVVPVIIMTAFPERAKDAHGIEHFPLIEKPIDSGQLIACIEDVLGRPVG